MSTCRQELPTKRNAFYKVCCVLISTKNTVFLRKLVILTLICSYLSSVIVDTALYDSEQTMTSKQASFSTVHGLPSSRSLFSKKEPKQVFNSSRNPLRLREETSKETAEHTLPNYILHEVDHYKQKHNWDCGVACIVMLLPSDRRRKFLDNFTGICKEEGFGESTWTIDLCYLLKRFEIEHCMYSVVIGVNEEFRRLSYYDNIIDLDRNRVQHRFEEAVACGIDIRQGELSNHRIKKHLIHHGPVIVLVDNGLLVCDLCKHNKMKYEFRKVFGGTYCGHYILLVGFSRGKVMYRDPGLSPRICAASFARLEEARRASGTDQDAILVYKNYR